MTTATTKIWVTALIVLAGGTSAGLLFHQRWSHGDAVASGGSLVPASLGQANPGFLAQSDQDAGRAGDESFKEPLMESFDRALDEADDIEDGDKQTAREILREADEVLSRVKSENRRALVEVNRQVRLKNCYCPNVILFVLDDTGYGDLGCYGQQWICTPTIDCLATEGTCFSEFYVGSGNSIPSRGTLMSGKLTARGQLVNDDWVTVRRGDATIAEVMFRGGYDTALYGLWGVGPISVTGHPNDQGFQTFLGYLDEASADDYYPPFLFSNREQVALEGNTEDPPQTYAPDVIVRQAREYIATRRRRPFFMVVSLPMQVVGDGREVPDLGIYAENDWPLADKTKAALLTRADTYLAQILATVEASNFSNGTVVMVTSDNGPSDRGGVDLAFFNSSGGLRGQKGELYEGAIRVPMIIKWAQAWRLEEGSCDFPWAMWDLLPTIADMTGTIQRPQGIDGQSLMARHDLDPPSPTELYWEVHRGGLVQAARLDQWKGIRSGVDQPWELYDLRTDTGETTDVASQYPEVVARIDQYVMGLRP